RRIRPLRVVNDGRAYCRFVLPGAILVVAAALGVSTTAGIALLLVPGPGALASGGMLLALSLRAVAAAFWVGLPADQSVSTRGRWMAVILVFAAAGLFGDGYTEIRGIRSPGFWTAVAALLFLAAPAYTLGSVLTALAARFRGSAALALVGAALGTVAA